ncbi:MAG: CorA family divalent cation transporter, partial [candidate division WOR-3 bacterium]
MSMQKTCEILEGRVVETTKAECPISVYVKPDSDERRTLVEVYGLDEHTLNSALDPDELARLEFEPGHTAFIFKLPKNYSAHDRLLFKVSSVGLFLFPERLIIVQSEDIALFEGRQFL